MVARSAIVRRKRFHGIVRLVVLSSRWPTHADERFGVPAAIRAVAARSRAARRSGSVCATPIKRQDCFQGGYRPGSEAPSDQRFTSDDVKGMPCGIGEVISEYWRRETVVKYSVISRQIPRHHANAPSMRCAQALSMPEGRASGRSTATSIDRAEHSARLDRVVTGRSSQPVVNRIYVRRSFQYPGARRS